MCTTLVPSLLPLQSSERSRRFLWTEPRNEPPSFLFNSSAVHTQIAASVRSESIQKSIKSILQDKSVLHYLRQHHRFHSCVTGHAVDSLDFSLVPDFQAGTNRVNPGKLQQLQCPQSDRRCFEVLLGNYCAIPIVITALHHAGLYAHYSPLHPIQHGGNLLALANEHHYRSTAEFVPFQKIFERQCDLRGLPGLVQKVGNPWSELFNCRFVCNNAVGHCPRTDSLRIDLLGRGLSTSMQIAGTCK